MIKENLNPLTSLDDWEYDILERYPNSKSEKKNFETIITQKEKIPLETSTSSIICIKHMIS